MRRFRRACLAVAALAGLLAAPQTAAAQGADWQANDDDSLLFDIRLGQFQLGNGVRGYQTPEGVCLNLPDLVASLDLPLTIDKAKGIAQGWAFEERNQLRIDRTAARVQVGNRHQGIGKAAIRDTPSGWCVDVKNLSSWLGVELSADFTNSLLVITSKTKLPVQLAAERRARAARVRPRQELDMSKLPQARLPYRMWRMPSLDAVVTVGGLKDRTQGSRFDRQYELYASGEIARMSADARLASNVKGMPESFRMRAYRSDVNGRLLGPLHATHFEIGDVSSFTSPLVAQSTPGRGVMVTNRPLDRPDTFDRKTFRGELPNGWDAELYRNEQLLAVAQPRGDGRYEFVDVPLVFGQNRVEVVLYGPQGQVRRIRESLLVGAESIPPRQTWYWASVNEAQKDMVSWGKGAFEKRKGWRAGIGLERGIDRRTSFALQAHTLMLDDERLTYIEGSVRRSIGSALVEVGAAVEAGGGLAAHVQMLAQFGRTYVTAESVLSRNFRSDRVENQEIGRHKLSLDRSFDLGKVTIPAHLEARYVQLADGSSSLEGGARLSAGLGRFSVTAAADWRMQRSEIGPDPPSTLEASLLGNGSIGRTRLRGELRWQLRPNASFRSATLVAERPIGLNTSLRGELGYDRGYNRMRVGVGYVRRFDRFALSATGETASDGSIAAGLNLAFSLGRNPTGGFRVTSQKLASTGTVLARVFRDENNDGLRGPGELYEKDVRLLVQRVPTENGTNGRGEIVIDGLAPHLPVLIGVDASSLPDPLVQPAVLGVAVTARPGLTTAIELPLVGTGEIVGTLIGIGGRQLEGVDIELVNEKGLVTATARSDFDGFFLFESVPYGKYQLRLNKLSAAAAGLDQPLQVRVEIDRAHPSVRLGRVEAGGPLGYRLAYRDVLMEGPGTELVLAHRP